MGKRIAILAFAFLVFMSSPAPAGYQTHEIDRDDKKSVVSIAEAADTPKTVARKVWVTAYSSTPEETDDTPFITASMTEVRDGIVAANFLPFGTKIMIPGIFGEKIFVVEDRMHQRKTNFVDVWMPTKEDAIDFGITKTEIIILEA